MRRSLTAALRSSASSRSRPRRRATYRAARSISPRPSRNRASSVGPVADGNIFATGDVTEMKSVPAVMTRLRASPTSAARSPLGEVQKEHGGVEEAVVETAEDVAVRLAPEAV